MAEVGVNPRGLMERMGHSTSRAALTYRIRPAPGSITWPTPWRLARSPNSTGRTSC